MASPPPPIDRYHQCRHPSAKAQFRVRSASFVLVQSHRVRQGIPQLENRPFRAESAVLALVLPRRQPRPSASPRPALPPARIQSKRLKIYDCYPEFDQVIDGLWHSSLEVSVVDPSLPAMAPNRERQ